MTREPRCVPYIQTSSKGYQFDCFEDRSQCDGLLHWVVNTFRFDFLKQFDALEQNSFLR